MAATILITVGPMPIPLTSKLLRVARWLLWIPALLAMHYGLVASLLALGASAPVNTQDNAWLVLADRIAFRNPDVDVAIARYERERALITAPAFRNDHLRQARVRWDRAAEARPFWPYYQLGALDAVVLLNAPAEDIRQRFSAIVSLAPNERGLDRGLLELALFSWHKLTTMQQEWVLERIPRTTYATRRFLFGVADQLHLKPLLCARLPWTQVKNFCRG